MNNLETQCKEFIYRKIRFLNEHFIHIVESYFSHIFERKKEQINYEGKNVGCLYGIINMEIHFIYTYMELTALLNR